MKLVIENENKFRKAIFLGLFLASLLILCVRSDAQATYQAYQNPKIQLFDNLGAIASGFKLCSFAAGTTTPLVTYADNAGTPNSNPVVMDGNGRATIYLGASSYKFILYDASGNSSCPNSGVSIWSQDNISDIGQLLKLDAVITDPAVGVSQTITQQASTALNVAGVMNVQNFETIRFADRFAGSDCGAKINAADTDLGATPGEIWVNPNCGTTWTTTLNIGSNAQRIIRVSPGAYTISHTISPAGRVKFVCQGNLGVSLSTFAACRFIKPASLNAVLVSFLNAAQGSAMEGFTIDAIAGSGGNGVQILANSIELKDVEVINQAGHGIYVGEDTIEDGTQANSWTLVRVRSNTNKGHGFYINKQDLTASASDANGGTCLNCVAQSNGQAYTITNFAISGNVVTFTATNSFIGGESGVFISGLAVGTYLNTVNGSPSWNVQSVGAGTFTATAAGFAHADVASTPDAGKASYGDGVKIRSGINNTFVGLLSESNKGAGVRITTNAGGETFSGGDLNEGNGQSVSCYTGTPASAFCNLLIDGGVVIPSYFHGTDTGAASTVSDNASFSGGTKTFFKGRAGLEEVAFAPIRSYGIGTSLNIDGTSTRFLVYATTGVNRWLVGPTATSTESGTNAGSDYQWLSRDDSGAAIGIAGTITRKTMAWTIGGSLAIADEGSCTMAAGTCSAQSLSRTYAAAPKCIVTWNGTGALAGILKAPSSTTTVTPASSNAADTAVVNWACFGN